MKTNPSSRRGVVVDIIWSGNYKFTGYATSEKGKKNSREMNCFV